MALATLDKEKEEALKDLDAQVSSAWISMLTVPAVPVAVTRAYTCDVPASCPFYNTHNRGCDCANSTD